MALDKLAGCTCRRAVAVGLGALLVAGASALTGAPSAGAVSASVVYQYTGDPQYFVVPDGVSQLTIGAYGAEGGRSFTFASDLPLPKDLSADGGLGGVAQATVAVTPGDKLQINVGGRGGDGRVQLGQRGYAHPGTPGFNGGGEGSLDLVRDSNTEASCAAAGGGGGGASDVRTGVYGFDDRVVVGAGGGGGGGLAFVVGGLSKSGIERPTEGGGGGGMDGESGKPVLNLWPGTGGTQVAGGTFSGTKGIGGDGVTSSSGPGLCSTQAEGGGGGGVYGGGAGFGGGGGSSFPIDATIAAVRGGDGLVFITYGGAPPGQLPDPGGSPDPASGGGLPVVALPATPRFTG